MKLDILVVDDETDIRELVAGVLEDEGYETRGAADSDAALEARAKRQAVSRPGIRRRRPAPTTVEAEA